MRTISFALTCLASFAAAVLVTASFATVSVAQDAPDSAADPASDAFQTHLDAALEHYEARRYAEAAVEFQAAFDVRPEPELQYNIARSLERALRREGAIEAYERFLELPGTTSEMRRRASDARNDLRAELASMNPTPAAEPTATERAHAASEEPAPPPPSRGGGSDLSPIGWIVLGLGVATAGVGAVFGGMAVAANDDFNATSDRAEQVRLQADVGRYALLTDILVGTGAALAIAGVVFLVVSIDSGNGQDQAAVDLTPIAGPDLVGLSVSGAF